MTGTDFAQNNPYLAILCLMTSSRTRLCVSNRIMLFFALFLLTPKKKGYACGVKLIGLCFDFSWHLRSNRKSKMIG